MREQTPLACVETCLKILKEEPSNPVVNLYAAASRYLLKEYEKCLDHLEKVILAHPRDVAAYHLKGSSLWKLGQHAKALTYFDEALKLDDRHLSTVTSRATLLEQMGRIEEAATGFRKASFIHRTHHSCFKAAECYAKLKRYQESIEFYDLAIEVFKFEPASHIGKSNVLIAQGKMRSALDAIDNLLYELPDNPRGLLAKAVILHTHLNESQKALGVIEKLQAVGQDENMTILAIKGAACHNLNRLEEALAIFEKILLRNPKDAVALRAKADILQKMGGLTSEEASALQAQAEAIEASQTDDLLELGSIAWKESRFDDALEHYEKICKIQSENAIAHLGRGVALCHLGRAKEAKSALQYAVALQPKMPVAHYYLAKIFKAQNELESAAKAFKKAFKQQPDNIDAIWQAAQLYEQLKEFDDAIDAYDELLEVKPGHKAASSAKLALLKAANSL